MEELIGNILENACKVGKKIIIRFDNIGDNEMKVIFSDDGPGLPNEEMKKVFAKSFRLDEQTPGSGLGLNIVKT